MEVRQISVFLENKAGQLAALCALMAESGINIKALNIAETNDYGVVRLIVDKPLQCLALLTKEGIVCNCSEVVAVRVPDVPGALAKVLNGIASKGISFDYMYSMLAGGRNGAVMLFQTDSDLERFAEAGLDTLSASELGILE